MCVLHVCVRLFVCVCVCVRACVRACVYVHAFVACRCVRAQVLRDSGVKVVADVLELDDDDAKHLGLTFVDRKKLAKLRGAVQGAMSGVERGGGAVVGVSCGALVPQPSGADLCPNLVSPTPRSPSVLWGEGEGAEGGDCDSPVQPRAPSSFDG